MFEILSDIVLPAKEKQNKGRNVRLSKALIKHINSQV